MKKSFSFLTTLLFSALLFGCQKETDGMKPITEETPQKPKVDTLRTQADFIRVMKDNFTVKFYQTDADSYTLLVDSVIVDGKKFNVFANFFSTLPGHWGGHISDWTGQISSDPKQISIRLAGVYYCEGFYDQSRGTGDIWIKKNGKVWYFPKAPIQIDRHKGQGFLTVPSKVIIY